ncbi:ShlB/FhaC/HecB family hemolysin secretion/activation protein [Salipiger bermudensis]|uniref:ShlB/FhaC/HecB family hemolysin secretion/activation protein n=1 Tax=Salipiger bermudensis TaxID=344736 RepID=UPI001CD4879D|nr:ShlB/FhaC/HecB family hemolysin secretion/activation protein [Salipiger bermudensis]MCA0962422.1 hypothetical protein [Salipiger bermudensis]
MSSKPTRLPHRAAALRPAVLLLGAGVALTGGSALAQTAGQLAEPSYAPPVISAEGGGVVLPAGTGAAAPAGAESLFVTPSGLRVEGALPGVEAETAAIAERLTNRRVSAAALFAAASELEAAYARAGYVLARVVLPPQTVADGAPLTLSVIDGHVSGVETEGLPPRAASRVTEVLAPLVGQRQLTRHELERRLLLAGDIPGLELGTTLKAGEQLGTTVLVETGTARPVTGFFALNNELSDDLGTTAFSLGADLNNLWGQGEVVYLRLGGSAEGLDDDFFGSDPLNRQVVAGFTAPLGIDGVWINGEVVDSRNEPDRDSGLTLSDGFRRTSLVLGWTELRSRTANHTFSLGFDWVETSQELQFGDLKDDFTEDRLRVLRLTAEGDHASLAGGRVRGTVTASFGLDAFGARSASDTLPLSRDGASPDFTTLAASGSYRRLFADGDVALRLSGKAQTSFGDALPSSEMMGITGANWLSAFDTGTLTGDSAAVIRAEMSLPRTYPGPIQAAPYAFAAAGVAWLEEPTAQEEARAQGTSFGIGAEFGASLADAMYPGADASFRIEYARGNLDDGTGFDDRLNLSLVSRF